MKYQATGVYYSREKGFVGYAANKVQVSNLEDYKFDLNDFYHEP